MKIGSFYSHLNGYERVQHHKPKVWKEIEDVITKIDAETYRTNESKENGKLGKKLYAPDEINTAFKEILQNSQWLGQRTSNCYVTDDYKLIRRTMHLNADAQKQAYLDALIKN